MSVTTNKRREIIYDQILTNETISVNELATLLNVSSETIRKDLIQMDEQGLITKIHGGAQIKKEYYQLPVDIKANDHALEKERIAKAAIEFIHDSSMIYLDSSSTSLKIVRYLPLKKNLTIVTNALQIAQAVTNMNHELVFLGGFIQKKSHSSSGIYACNFVDTLKIDVAFNGTDGFLDMKGPSTFARDEIQLKQHILERSKCNILICDSSKFNKSASYAYARYKDFDILITNEITDQQKQLVSDIKKIICA